MGKDRTGYRFRVSVSGSGSSKQTVEELCRTEHQDLLGALTNESRWSKEADLGVGNQVVASTHESRTVLELIQNARDAIRDGSDDDGRVAVIVGPESLLIANTGRPFELDDDDVFEAVTGLGRSEKLDNSDSIGEKGVGLKSLLQLSERFSVHSVVDDDQLSAQFSRYRAGQMLLAGYDHYLKTNLRNELDVESSVIESYQSILDEILDEEAWSRLPSTPDIDTIAERESTEEQAPPAPSEFLTDLPRLSLFRYPFLISTDREESDATGRLVDALLKTGQSSSSTATPDNKWLEDHADTYQTVVRLDYDDPEWTGLLDSVQNALAESGRDIVDAFETNRRSANVGGLSSDKTPQAQFWDECTDLSASTLVLLGELDEIDFLKLEGDDTEETGSLEISDRREVTIETDSTHQSSIGDDPELSRIPHTVTEETTTTAGTTTHEREFLRYSQTLTPEVHQWLTDEDRDIDAESATIDILLEQPRPEAADWEPTPEPLHLYYPISDASTPFPFVIHAPFEVSFDRQHLATAEKNQTLLKELPTLIATVSEDLIQSNEATHAPPSGYRSWMPWLVAPVDVAETDAETSLANGIADTLSRLQDTAIVPTDSQEPLQPTATLLDPTRLEAFEALRGRDAAPPIPATEVIANGKAWKADLPESGPSDQSQFNGFLSQIGLTTIIETIAADASEDDLVTVLCDFWKRASTTTPDGGFDAWHVTVEQPTHAELYFEAIAEALAGHGADADDDDENDAEVDAATRLGRHGVPLLPAEKHKEGTSTTESEEATVTRLVRARPSEGQSDDGSRQRSERIVFRRQEPGESQQSMAELPTPPQQLPVYIIPYQNEWVGPLKRHNRRWGTRELEGQAAFYRRVGAEAGGFSGDENGDPDVVGYLADLYKQSTAGQTAEWVTPQPFHNKQFDDVEEVFAYDTLTGTPTDYDAFLERRYVQTIPLPTDDGNQLPAERLVFGPEWAERFSAVADSLASENGVEYPFSGTDDGEAEPAAKFRRWAAAIECRQDFEPTDTPTLAPPSDEQWEAIHAQMDLSEAERKRWELYFLLHLGVQVGPHIDWGWLFPGRGTDDRRTGALSLSEVQSLADADPEFEANPPISPPEDLLERYQTISWRSEHHPAFSAGHSGSCQKDWLDCDIEEWEYNKDLAIPTWWHLTELNPDADRDHREAVRDATALIWPELTATITDTAWYCDGTHYSHQPNTHDATIPALGVVQLQDAALWPVTEPDTDDDPAEPPGGLMPEDLHTARPLITADEQRGAASYLPRLDLDEIIASIESRFDSDGELPNVDIASLPTMLGARPLDGLTPAQAADRLNEFLTSRAVADTHRTYDHQALSAMESTWDSQSNTVPTYGLLRRLTATSQVSRKLTDEEPKRQWIRRDIWHTGVRLPVRWADDSLILHVEEDVPQVEEPELRIYTQQIPQHAREQFANDESIAIVERPSREARAIAYLLGGAPDGPIPPFGIQTETEQPDLGVPEDESEPTAQEQDAIEDLKSTLKPRIIYLLAAYDADVSEPDHRSVYNQLNAIINNPIGIIENPEGTSSRRSTQWSPPTTAEEKPNQIAIYRSAIDEHSDDSTEIPLYLVADGLAQVIDQYSLRDVFENILIKPDYALDYDYAEQKENVRKELSELREQRFKLVQAALRTLLSNIDETASPPELHIDPDDDVEPTLEKMANAPNGTEDTVVNAWVEAFTTAGLAEPVTRHCIAAAATEEFYARLQYIATALQNASELHRDDLRGHQVWDELDSWPTDSDVEPLRKYLTAVAKIDAFWATYTDSESDVETAFALAVETAANPTAPPAPLTPVIEGIPAGDRVATALRDRLLIELPKQSDGPIPESIITTVAEWHATRHETFAASLSEDDDTSKLLKAFTTALENPTESLATVIDALNGYREDTGGGGGPTSHAKRRELTMQWVSASDAELDDAVNSSLTLEDAPEDGGAPSIGSTSSSTPTSNAEIADDRGREAELLCLARTWNQFRTQDQSTRERIIEELTRWRSADIWRMKPVEAIADIETDEPAIKDERPEVVLRQATISDESPYRTAFRLLFDVSDERGPGFDYIDPFAGMDEEANSGWRPEHMRRVEVKAVTPDRATNGRIKLTGNEFRMARRRGPDPLAGELPKKIRESTDRYLLRLVSLPRAWRSEDDSGNDITVRDIQDFVDYGNFEEDDEPLWEKLRGGEFYVSFGSGD